MKTKEQIEERLDGYNLLLESYWEELEEYRFWGKKKSAKIIEERIKKIENKINALKWVLED